MFKKYWCENIRIDVPRSFHDMTSKLYCNDREKHQRASETYYIEDVLSCLKNTFLKERTKKILWKYLQKTGNY